MAIETAQHAGSQDPSAGRDGRRRRALAVGAIAGQALFVGGVLVLGAHEGHGYSAMAHDVSDLAAVGAEHASTARVIDLISGASTIALALGALRPALRIPGRSGPAGAWLLALSLPALDNFTDTFFWVDCQAADPACGSSEAFASWHAQAHVACFLVALVAAIATPFALAHRMRLVNTWRDLARRTKAYGVVAIVALAFTGVTTGTSIQGLTQRLAVGVACSGVVALAVALLHRTEGSDLT